MAVVGIDFGSLGSKIGVARHRGIDIITNEVSNRATPSLVSFGPKQRSIGESAKTQEVSNFKNTIGSLKRLIGRSASDPEITEIEKKFINAELVNTNGTVGVKVKYLKEQHEFSATQLTAMFFGKLRDIASKELKQIVHDVVIAVPGWYTEVQRRAVMDAAAIANLNPLRLINDTTAVALGYGITKSDLPDPENPRFVVFIDVGHSNLSATVVAFSKNQLHVRATAYDRHLGGRDIDFALVRHFATEFKEKYKIDVLSNPKATFRLAAGCEKLKKVLSANFEGNLSVESIMNDIDASSRLNRDQFEALIAPLLDRVTAPILQALSDADITPDKVDAVELVGGSSRVSAIRQRIQSVFPGKALSSTLNQDEAVARGATFQCAMASPVFRVREFSLHDVNAYPIKVHWERSESDPDEDTELVVFSQGNIMPSTKILTFYRNGPFDLEAAYVDPSELPGNPNPFIGKFTAKHTATGEGGDLTAVKVKTRLTANGLVSFEAAYTEEIEEKEAAMDVDGAEAQEPPKKKKIVRKHEIPFVAHYGSLDSTILNAFKESEANMHAADKLVMDTEDRKNALEEYVYDMRGKLDDRYAAYVQPAEKEATIAALQEAEDWLYSDEGEDATKSVYQERLDKLKVHGDPITFRWKEADERPRVMSALRDTLNGYMAQATSTDEKWSHIDESEKQKVVEKCASISQWLDDKVARQAEKPKNVAPVVTTAEMQAKRDEVIYFATPIFSKPKPKPPVVDPTSGTNTPKQDAPPKEQPPAPETAPPPEPQEMDVD